MNPQREPVILTPHDLPLHCSGPTGQPWNGHPRVFLPIESNRSIECPYCGTVYQLNGEIKSHH
ncbi:MAG: zinc-finger domain-containing protein [Eikenella sp.]|nr:zinc-finger domain-containing protein [Eikenella sp.]